MCFDPARAWVRKGCDDATADLVLRRSGRFLIHLLACCAMFCHDTDREFLCCSPHLAVRRPPPHDHNRRQEGWQGGRGAASTPCA
eukprot:754970-Hanusia_phi.AAC.1